MPALLLFLTLQAGTAPAASSPPAAANAPERFSILVPVANEPCVRRRDEKSADGKEIVFQAVCRIDTPQEVLYYLNGGILPYVLRQLLTK